MNAILVAVLLDAVIVGIPLVAPLTLYLNRLFRSAEWGDG